MITNLKRWNLPASNRSAADPCRSPLESFLNAYDTEIGRLHKYCPFIASIAASDASKLAKLINAKPLEFPVSGSLIILGVCKITPNAENVSYNNFSSTSGSRLPMNIFAPTSKFFWWAEALLTRIGFPYSLIMFIILIA